MLTSGLRFVNKGSLKFQRCRRLGQIKAGSSQPRKIIVKFHCFPDGELVWNRTFSGTNLYMNEDFPKKLSRSRSKLYPAFKPAKEMHHKAKMQSDKLIVVVLTTSAKSHKRQN